MAQSINTTALPLTTPETTIASNAFSHFIDTARSEMLPNVQLALENINTGITNLLGNDDGCSTLPDAELIINKALLDVNAGLIRISQGFLTSQVINVPTVIAPKLPAYGIQIQTSEKSQEQFQTVLRNGAIIVFLSSLYQEFALAFKDQIALVHSATTQDQSDDLPSTTNLIDPKAPPTPISNLLLQASIDSCPIHQERMSDAVAVALIGAGGVIIAASITAGGAIAVALIMAAATEL